MVHRLREHGVDMMATVVGCVPYITDEPLPEGKRAIIRDKDSHLECFVNRAELLDDPEGVVLEIVALCNEIARHYSLAWDTAQAS